MQPFLLKKGARREVLTRKHRTEICQIVECKPGNILEYESSAWNCSIH